MTVKGGSVSNAKPYQFSMDSVRWQTNRIFRKLSGGVYTLYAMDGNGCKTKTTAKLEEPPRITLTVLPKDTMIKIGYPVQLESRINSKDTIKQYVFKYQWIPTEGLDCSDCARSCEQAESIDDLYAEIRLQ
ncbi:MAG: hypothetical protein IPK03_05300 [Bacteroidetes bacterium]|nr:hypothetical protein [Bacteroidota bacterium]